MTDEVENERMVTPEVVWDFGDYTVVDMVGEILTLRKELKETKWLLTKMTERKDTAQEKLDLLQSRVEQAKNVIDGKEPELNTED